MVERKKQVVKKQMTKATRRTSPTKQKKANKKSHVKKAQKLEASPTWTASEKKQLDSLNTPAKIQAYLDNLAYDPEDGCRSVRSTLNTRKAHCLGGALLAAYCLERAGFGRAQIVGMESDPDIDDGHAIAVYKVAGLWGCAAKSNYTMIRSRDPVYRTLRELVMSYHDFYFNSKGQKSLLSYSVPIDLNKIDRKVGGRQEWIFAPANKSLDKFENEMDKLPVKSHLPLNLTKETIKCINRASPILLKAALLGSNPAGLFKV